MGSGWHEWPLMIFTVFGQCVVGAFIVLALALLKGDLRPDAQQRVVTGMFALWVLDGYCVYCLDASPGFAAARIQLAQPRGGVGAE